jgi:hypothetical protein
MTEREARFRDALDRIARFAECYELVSESSVRPENVGSALCVTLGRYARRVLNEEFPTKALVEKPEPGSR